ncbi:MAG TPA: energy transducer TonB [Candidatus Obscuribacterales bacterium]
MADCASKPNNRRTFSDRRGSELVWPQMVLTTVLAVFVLEPKVDVALAQSSASNHSVSQPSSFDSAPYMADLQRRLKKHWFPPQNSEFKNAVVSFKVHSGGELSDLKLVRSSGQALIDNVALKAVEDAAPYRPLPTGAPEHLDIRFTFPTRVAEATGFRDYTPNVALSDQPKTFSSPAEERQLLSNQERDRILAEMNSRMKPYESVYEAPSANGKSTTRQMWDGKHIRFDTDDLSIIFDFPGKTVISLLNREKKCFKIPMTADRFSSIMLDPRRQALSAEQRQALSGKELGAKVVNGHPCHGYEYSVDNAGHEKVVSTIWIGDDTQNMMVQFEHANLSGKSVITALKSYKEGIPEEDLLKISDGFVEMKSPAGQ